MFYSIHEKCSETGFFLCEWSICSLDLPPVMSFHINHVSFLSPPVLTFQFNICSANKRSVAAEKTFFSSDLLRTMAAPEIRMFIYGHQYLIEFTLILCRRVQKSLHGCLNIKINWSRDTVKRLGVIVLGEQVASQASAWTHYTYTHIYTHILCAFNRWGLWDFPLNLQRGFSVHLSCCSVYQVCSFECGTSLKIAELIF